MSRYRFALLTTILILLLGIPLNAQAVNQLPSVMPLSEEYPVSTAAHSKPWIESFLEPKPTAFNEPPESDLPPGARNGVFQKLIFESSWLAPNGSSGLGMNKNELKTVLALPIPSRKWPLLITPGFAVHSLEGPAVPDMPARVHDAYVQFRSLGMINSKLGAEFAITPGYYGDFDHQTDESFRITGHAAAMYECSDTLKIVAGASYINSYYADVIPIGGLIWEPNDDWKVEFLFPRPRIACRIDPFRTFDDVQHWLYLLGEFANDTWAIRRMDDTDDTVTYRDWRLILGLERKQTNHLDAKLEVAYIFGRKLHFASNTPEFEPTATIMLRAGLTY